MYTVVNIDIGITEEQREERNQKLYEVLLRAQEYLKNLDAQKAKEEKVIAVSVQQQGV